MILFELVGLSENDPRYQQFEIENGTRQYDFLRSIVNASLAVDRAFISSYILQALNFHAITCLHTSAGDFRPCPVTVGPYNPPDHYRVKDLVDDLVNIVNRGWESGDPIALASYVLWRLNHIHPFINGNGRTARAAAYFVVCVKLGGWLPGSSILPELLRRERVAYVDALRQADASLSAGALDLSVLQKLLTDLLTEQLKPFMTPPPPAGPAAAPALPPPKP